MQIAICAPFMQSDLWQERLRRASPRHHLEFDEFYSPEDIRTVHRFRYDACIVAIAGAVGLEVVIAAREQNADVPLLWFSDDDQFGSEAFRLRAVMLLGLDCSDRELEEAMQKIQEGRSVSRNRYASGTSQAKHTAQNTATAAKKAAEKTKQVGRFVWQHKKGFAIALALVLILAFFLNGLRIFQIFCGA